MSSHVIILFDRAPTANYPTSLTGSEQPLYDAGLAYKYPVNVRVDRGGAGAGSIVKLQGAPLPLGNCVFATRGPGAEQGRLVLSALSGDFYQVQMTQLTGTSQAISSTFSGGLLTIKLPTDSRGRPSGTIDVVEAYVTASLSSDFAAAKSGTTSIGLLGETFGARPCGREHWEDIVSTVGGLLAAAVEHTVTPSAGSFSELALEMDARNYYAVRALAKSAGSPATGDHVTVLATVEGA